MRRALSPRHFLKPQSQTGTLLTRQRWQAQGSTGGLAVPASTAGELAHSRRTDEHAE